MDRIEHTLADGQVATIIAARHELGIGPHRLAPVVGSSRSTIGDVLRRHGLSRLDRTRPADRDPDRLRPRTAWVAG